VKIKKIKQHPSSV